MRYLTVVFAFAPFVAASQLVWPSKWDEVEDLYTMIGGFRRRGFADAITTCAFGTNIPGRQNSAEWIRTAFHDAVTHNAKAGTGGIDASIFWELDRPENPGSAFNNTFGFFSGFHNPRASASDLVALGVVVATGACVGPKIPFRAGRIDANKAGPPGVPEPQTNLADTLAAFIQAGFSKQDMTAMVACGHALGGVHSVDFPDITGIHVDPDNETSVPFQKDVSSFHNGVVTEFLSGKTKNPLVIASNNTLNSDKRIFSSDHATMKKLATKAGFNSICADVFTRMIDTVPRKVKLTRVIDAYDVKPYIDDLSLNSKGNLHFQGTIRMRITKGSGRNPDDLSVKLVYADRNGKGKVVVPAKRANFQLGLSSGIADQFVSFDFDTTINGKSGISKFWVQETVPSTKFTKTHDNQKTGGYKVDDTILYQLSQSCLKSDALANGAAPMIVTAMVRDSYASGPLTLRVVHKVPRQGVAVPQLKTEVFQFKATGKRSNGWVAYQAKAKVFDQFTTFDIALGGSSPTAVEFLQSGSMPTTCPS
ncbi:L-ascorbate peroxidase 5, peroxisomal [Ilyonectria robusta]